jgi:sporulation protein YlmC with PRC-barrel domain
MRNTTTMDRYQELRGAPVVDTDGSKLGTVEHFFLDIETDEPKWLGVKTGVLGGRVTFIPLQNAQIEGNTIHVPFTKEQTESSPDVIPDAISRFSEQQLLTHYGMTAGYEQPAAGYQQRPVREPLDARLRRWDWENRTW